MNRAALIFALLLVAQLHAVTHSQSSKKEQAVCNSSARCAFKRLLYAWERACKCTAKLGKSSCMRHTSAISSTDNELTSDHCHWPSRLSVAVKVLLLEAPKHYDLMRNSSTDMVWNELISFEKMEISTSEKGTCNISDDILGHQRILPCANTPVRLERDDDIYQLEITGHGINGYAKTLHNVIKYAYSAYRFSILPSGRHVVHTMFTLANSVSKHFDSWRNSISFMSSNMWQERMAMCIYTMFNGIMCCALFVPPSWGLAVVLLILSAPIVLSVLLIFVTGTPILTTHERLLSESERYRHDLYCYPFVGASLQREIALAAKIFTLKEAIQPHSTECDECAVCLKSVQVQHANVRVTRCGHVIHWLCILHWVRFSHAAKCPICKQLMFDEFDEFVDT